MTPNNFDVRPADERLDGFAAELDALDGYGVERYPSEVAVVVYSDQDTLGTDINDLLQKGHDYSLVAFDGDGGEIVTIHFKPVESIYGDD